MKKTSEGYLVPLGTESDGFLVDGMVLVKPGDEGYDEWDAFYKLSSIGEDDEEDDEPIDFEDDEDDVEF